MYGAESGLDEYTHSFAQSGVREEVEKEADAEAAKTYTNGRHVWVPLERGSRSRGCEGSKNGFSEQGQDSMRRVRCG
ncbi:uncharacterized protein MYCGRDRAFT_84656 [Zymoseptoria tritici IPO323]|uniref:Uncharacterized protein n=1 Tax=Zymoseptoria tritici (strain CBS 115943 / IPO323) TaxID=336722 RepID=F9X3S4_ZYMTI|nr:uncharacterized protein MYCGRDRAFT_84656 [Zymoseptoria tritici IPO323]EGP89949.1 hypothetical protein MYCGRDRAFT_84656 [Zymoseptoria tritici IPO323]